MLRISAQARWFPDSRQWGTSSVGLPRNSTGTDRFLAAFRTDRGINSAWNNPASTIHKQDKYRASTRMVRPPFPKVCIVSASWKRRGTHQPRRTIRTTKNVHHDTIGRLHPWYARCNQIQKTYNHRLRNAYQPRYSNINILQALFFSWVFFLLKNEEKATSI